ncbi:MAG: aldo/keto reductase [Clostridia bacterium]|nr:aldo/keto reductase [Clostridia bacterium]
MKYCNIGEMNLSRIMVGCMRIGDKPLPQTESLIVEAVRAGVNAFDLADIYGGGDSEKVFGVAVKDLGLTREDYFVQTKCGIRRSDAGKWYDFSKEHILNSVDGSLQRLKMEYIDILLLHRPDTLMEGEEIAEAFARLKESGKVRAFGVSNFSAAQMRMLRSCGVKIAVDQMQFSLGHTALVDVGLNVNTGKDEATTRAGDALEYCREKGITLQAWSPLQWGWFEGVFVGDERFPALNEKLNTLAEKYDCTPAAIALAWILRHPAKMQAVTGTTSPERMQSLCKAADIDLTREEWYSLYLATGKTLP